jgi:hypothetical protein
LVEALRAFSGPKVEVVHHDDIAGLEGGDQHLRASGSHSVSQATTTPRSANSQLVQG